MGHSIPVFFFAIDAGRSIPSNASWADAQDLIGTAIDTGTLWQDTSRNWWHVYVTRRIAEVLGLHELAFLESECAFVPVECLAGVASAIARIEHHLRSGERPPDLAGDHDYEIVANPAYTAELETVEPIRDNHSASASVREQARCYYSFLRSLKAAIAEARARGGSLVVVQPQP